MRSHLNVFACKGVAQPMRALKKIREVPSRLNGSFESRLAQFSATTLELNPSVGTAEFARRLTTRAAEMLGARAVVLALGRGTDWEIAALTGPAERWDVMVEDRLAKVPRGQGGGPAAERRFRP